MNSLRNKIPNRKLLQNALLQVQSITTSSAASSEIQIPNRKERGSTDILRALEKTIGVDVTAPQYKYIDDPFLIPTSNLDKRSFALAREAGRKAAKWIRQEHAEYFQHRDADPVIECFLPKTVYTDKNQVSEELLLNNIKSGNVTDSFKIYNLLEGDVQVETKLAFYEMLCFYNSTQPIDDELVEERWFTNTHDRNWMNTWKTIPEQNALFESLVEQGGDVAAAAHNALICGLAKYKNAQEAWDRYEACRQEGIPIYKRTFDYLISVFGSIQKAENNINSMLLNLFNEMRQKNLQPDVGTLNASLSLAVKMNKNREILAMKIMNEFKAINVKPSLISYLHMLDIFSTSQNAAEVCLTDILDQLEGQKIELRDPQDVRFFVNAMELACDCNSLVLGKRLHELLLIPGNYVLIGDSFKENVYYRFYLLLHLNTLDFESFMKIYFELTPNIYTPELSVFKAILEAAGDQDPNDTRKILPTLFSQVVIIDFLRMTDLAVMIFKMMTGHCKPPPESPYNKTFAEFACTAWNHIQEMQSTNRRGNITYSAALLNELAVLSIRGDEFDQMLSILSVLLNSKNAVLGQMKPESIKEIFDACIARGHTQIVFSLIEYAIEYGMDEGITMGIRAYKTLPLTEGQLSKLETMIGKDILQTKLSEDVS